MKKIISLLSAMAMITTSFMAFVSTASADEKPAKLRYDIKYDNADTPYAAGSTGSINFYVDDLELINTINPCMYMLKK